MRELINKYAYYVIGAAVVIALLLITFRGGGNPNVVVTKERKVFYFDEENGEESVLAMAKNRWPPLPGKSGSLTVVEACKFSSDGGKNVQIGYLLKYTDQAREELQAMADGDPAMPGLMDRGLLIRRPGDGQKWIPCNSLEGQQILANPIPNSNTVEQVFAK